MEMKGGYGTPTSSICFYQTTLFCEKCCMRYIVIIALLFLRAALLLLPLLL